MEAIGRILSSMWQVLVVIYEVGIVPIYRLIGNPVVDIMSIILLITTAFIPGFTRKNAWKIIIVLRILVGIYDFLSRPAESLVWGF
jgi:hypothetical protein